MIIFYTDATKHIADKIKEPKGDCTIKHFSDGELYVRVNEEVKGKQVWVIASTQPPAENMLKLFFLLDALQRAGASINLLITYFAYARQIVAEPGQALSAQVICTMLKNFNLAQLVIVHPHSITLHDFIQFEAVYDLDFFCTQAQEFDAVAAPDKGAATFAKQLADRCGKDLVLLTKMRPGHDQVKMLTAEGEIKNKKILLIDDIISTGHTLIAAADELKKNGATHVSAAVTHGIFAPGAREAVEQSVIDSMYVTNTIAQESTGKIVVIDVSERLHRIVMNHSL